jgi:hypothetical protein
MARVLHGASMEAAFPTVVGGFIERLLNEVTKDIEQTRGGETCGNHHDEFVAESALHLAI